MKTDTNRLTRRTRANRSRRPHKERQVKLSLTRLEERDNPSVPAALLDVPQLTFDFGQTGYSESHTLSKSFTNTITGDEIGGGNTGSYTVDVVGQTHLRDDATGSGGDISSATGTLTTDVSFHLVIHGTHTLLGDVVNDETYTENGSATETHFVARDFAGGGSEQADGDHLSTWTLSWSGTVTMSFSSFSYVRSDQTDWHLHDDYALGGYSDQRISTGWDVNETGSGSQATYTGHTWWEEHDHTHFPGSSGPPMVPPMDFYYDSSWNYPFSGSVQLSTDPRTQGVTWNAETPDAVNFSWHGVTTTSGTLTESATYADGQLDVSSFATTSHYSDSTHLIEDEPSVPDSGTGQENYHKDQTYAYVNDTTGEGSYIDGSYSADFHAVETGSDSAHNILTVTDDHSFGTNDDGEAFDLTFNYESDRTTAGTCATVFDYHEGDAGTTVVGSTYSSGDSSLVSYHNWGTLDGNAYNDSSVYVEGGSNSFSIPGSNVAIDPTDLHDAYPFNSSLNPAFLSGYGAFAPPPLPPEIWYVQNVPNPGFVYNAKIKEIGENAKLKVGKLQVNKDVMFDINNREKPRYTGEFTNPNNGKTFAQSISRGDDVDKKIKFFTEQMEILKYKDIKLTAVDVIFTYTVLDAGQNPRSGKCVVHYGMNFRFTATNSNGVQVNPVRNDIIGDLWFVDDNLKTMTLSP